MAKHTALAVAHPITAASIIAAAAGVTAVTTNRPDRKGRVAAVAMATAGLVLAPVLVGELPSASAHAGGADPAPEPTTASQPAVQPVAASTPTAATYKVVAGDTLSKIGAKLGKAWRDIASLNGISSPYVIQVNQVLRLPGAGAAPSQPAPAPASAASPAPAASTGKGAAAVSFAMAQVGDRYVYAGNGPGAWDCSGLTTAAWKSAGVSLPRTSAAQASAGTATTRANLVPGDLIVYFSPVSHVAMYIGNGQVVQAANEKYGVLVTAIDWAGPVTGYRHIG